MPFTPDSQIKFDYQIAMGVRFGEKDWQNRLDEWIAGHRDEVEQILVSCRVPLLDENGRLTADFNEQARADSESERSALQFESK